MSKSVLICYDVDGWAWHRRALGIQKYAPPEYSVDICSVKEYRRERAMDYDAVLNLDFSSLPPVREHPNFWGFVANEGIRFEHNRKSSDYRQRCASHAKNAKKAREKMPHYRGVITINHRTLDFLRSLNPNTHYMRTGVDCEQFYPTHPIRTRGPLRVGWCGKPSEPGRFTPKGYHEVLLPLQERLKDAPIEWTVNTHTYESGLDADGMREWYNSIDLLLITSSCEGTPSVLLEAAACGRGFVATDVGIVREFDECLGDTDYPAGWYWWGDYHSEAGAARVVPEMATCLTRCSHQELGGGAYYMGGLARWVASRCWNWGTLSAKWLERLFA